MNETLKQFKENQKRNQENLNKLLDFVKTGEKYGIKIEESFKAKINSTIHKALLIKNSGWRWWEAFLKGRHP
ncbi:hypothetical protein Kyoto34B_12950 [Helicobacter pylori]